MAHPHKLLGLDWASESPLDQLAADLAADFDLDPATFTLTVVDPHGPGGSWPVVDLAFANEADRDMVALAYCDGDKEAAEELAVEWASE